MFFQAGLTAEPDICVIDLKAEREKYAQLMLLVCTDGVPRQTIIEYGAVSLEFYII